MKLGLGTVQFGCSYGISNIKGQVLKDEVKRILDFAHKNGIDILDTASLYGNSEEILGQFDLSKFKIVTKTPKIDYAISGKENLSNFEKAFENSLVKLNQKSVYGLLSHESNDLLGEFANDLYNLIRDLKDKGLVEKIGVSVYTPEQLIKIIEKYEIDLVQLPMNILDQRFIPILKELKSKNIEIHTRSKFLQGLLLLKEEKINQYFDSIKNILTSIPSPKLAQALHFVNNIKEVDRIIVGTTCQKDLEEIVLALNENVENLDYAKYAISDERFILPQNWRL